MRVLLVTKADDPMEDVVAELAAIGWSVAGHVPVAKLDDSALRRAGVVLVAGGDGTVGKVARRLACTGIPMAVLPAGTANNVARTLGMGADRLAAVHLLEQAALRSIDLGIVREEGTATYFMEGFGVGVFASVLGQRSAHEQESREGKSLRGALRVIADHLESYQAQHVIIEVDGRNRSGHYLIAAVMNLRSFGPALVVAPQARCDDGELDVVLVRPEAKAVLLAQLRRAEGGECAALPVFESVRARLVLVRADGGWAHIDDEAHPLRGPIRLEVEKGAVLVLAPTG